MKIKLGDFRKLVSGIIRKNDDRLDEGFMNTARAAAVAALLASKAGADENPDNFAPIANQVDTDDDPRIVVLDDDDGTGHVFEIILELTVDGGRYAVLELKDPGTPAEESLYIFEVMHDERGEDTYREVEDSSTWERVRRAAEEILENED